VSEILSDEPLSDSATEVRAAFATYRIPDARARLVHGGEIPLSRSTLITACVVGGSLLVVALAYAYATGGFDRDHAVPLWVSGAPIAHRGLHTGDSVRPENSLAAFRAAADAGYAIELDVHLTSDGTAVVMHDENLEAMTGDPHDISELTAAQVARLRLLGGAERVPTLGAVLRTVDGRVPVFVEVKNPGKIGALEDAVAAELKSANGPVAVMSFNPFSLARIAEKAPNVPRGQLAGTFRGESLSFAKKFVLTRMLMNWRSRPQFIAYELEGLPSLGTWLQLRRGRPLVVWVARTHEAFARAEDFGDNVIFDSGGNLKP
jgi:glycerophosphoryl diester phosphodiesterase